MDEKTTTTFLSTGEGIPDFEKPSTLCSNPSGSQSIVIHSTNLDPEIHFQRDSPWILNNVFPSTRISASCLPLFLCVAAVTVCVRPLSSNLSKSAAVGGCLGQVFKGWRSKQVSPCTPSNEHDQWTNRIDDWYRCAITCQTQNPESSSHNIWCWKTERRNTGEKIQNPFPQGLIIPFHTRGSWFMCTAHDVTKRWPPHWAGKRNFAKSCEWRLGAPNPRPAKTAGLPWFCGPSVHLLLKVLRVQCFQYIFVDVFKRPSGEGYPIFQNIYIYIGLLAQINEWEKTLKKTTVLKEFENFLCSKLTSDIPHLTCLSIY